jgi:uncharacterized protein with von Willebrand factor type A (vWA) domain
MMAGSPSQFAPDRIERRLGPLDSLPRSCWLPAIVQNEGEPFARIGMLAQWHRCLLAGQVPLVGSEPGSSLSPEGKGLPADVVAALAAAFLRLDLGAACRGQPAVVEQVLRSLLWHVDRIAAGCDGQVRLTAIDEAVAAFESDWQERGESLREVLRLFESLDGLASLARWSELKGLLRSESWQDVLASLALLEAMPRLADLIRQLGRSREADDVVVQPLPDPRARGPDEWVRVMAEVQLPGTPVEVEGIRRSADLGSLLLGEVAWSSRRMDPVRSRRLKRLFAARLAEQSLLTFQHRSRWIEERRERRPVQALQPTPRPARRREAGPIIACIDTSASMAGGPERIAKAIVVEAVRVAAREGRACHVYAFGGSGEVQEFELGPDLAGLERLAAFVSTSFHGGTDLVEPLERALARIRSDAWRMADLLIASDGEFGPTATTVAAVAEARATLGLRVQGVLVGDRETVGLRSIVDDVFWVRDWRRYGGRPAQHDTPVHDSQLTRLYFPNLAGPSGGAATR